MSTTNQKETLFDASTTIYQQITKLRRGLPIAEAKAKSDFARLKIRKEYNTQIKELNAQYQAVYSILSALNREPIMDGVAHV